MDIASIIGAVTGCLSLAGIIYLVGYLKGTIDTKVKCLEQYPPAETALMAKTMWDIYVVDALRQRPDLAQHASSFKLTQNGNNLIPNDIKSLLTRIDFNPIDSEALATGWLVVKVLGLPTIEKMAREKDLSVQEAIAILSTFLDEHKNDPKPG